MHRLLRSLSEYQFPICFQAEENYKRLEKIAERRKESGEDKWMLPSVESRFSVSVFVQFCLTNPALLSIVGSTISLFYAYFQSVVKEIKKEKKGKEDEEEEEEM